MLQAQRPLRKPRELEALRQAAAVASGVLAALCDAIRPGMSTGELDRLAGQLIAAAGGRSAFLGYHGFPGQTCISLNDEVVHGIGTDQRIIQVGDLVGLDVGVHYEGFVGDNARTVCVGPPTGEQARLLEATQASLMAGIAAARAGNSVFDISVAIESTITPLGFGIVREFVGHGVGRKLHEPPEVPNFPRRESRRDKLAPGMVLAIEPMINAGTHRILRDADGWTIRTADGRPSAHFEHMVLVTETEPEILTWRKTQ